MFGDKKRGHGRWTGVLNKAVEIKQNGKVHDFLIEESIRKLTNTADATVVCLVNGIPRGVDYNQRIGNFIRMKSIELTLAFTPSGLLVNQPLIDISRVALVYDRQPSAGMTSSGSVPTYEDIFQMTGSVGFSDPFVFPNVNNSHRFIIIRDFLNILPERANPITGTTHSVVGTMSLGGANNNIIKEFIDLSGLETVFTGAATPITISQITTGALYVVLQGNHVFPTNAWWANMRLRLRYDDE